MDVHLALAVPIGVMAMTMVVLARACASTVAVAVLLRLLLEADGHWRPLFLLLLRHRSLCDQRQAYAATTQSRRRR